MHPRRFAAAVALPLLLASTAGAQAAVGQVDDFEDGSTHGWFVPDPSHPNPPTNVPTGGPTGADDSYMLLTSLGSTVAGPGSRMSVVNFGRWAGDYQAEGIGGMSMDVSNFGPDQLFLRLLVVNFPVDPVTGVPIGPPVAAATSVNAQAVASGSGWTRVHFSFAAGEFAPLFGTLDQALGNVVELRLFHNPDFGFGGPMSGAPPVTASLGVDNITATAVVPEPATVLLMGSGLLLLVPLARRRARR